MKHSNNSLTTPQNRIKRGVSVNVMSLDNGHCYVETIIKKKKKNICQLNIKRYRKCTT
jgi:hypothetical protein